jgi:hypothetical protein
VIVCTALAATLRVGLENLTLGFRHQQIRAGRADPRAYRPSTNPTRVVLATAHRNHNTADNTNANLAAFRQRCHMNHDQPEHKRRRWRTLFRRKASGDLFGGPYM